MINVTVSEARETLSDLLGKVQHGDEDVTIMRHGKPVAAMISMQAFAFLERMEDEWLSKLADESYAEYKADPNSAVSLDQFLAEDAAE